MRPVEIKAALGSMVCLVDSREQDTPRARLRLAQIGVPIERRALDFGDYSAYCTLPDGNTVSLAKSVVIERKMGLGELCNCYCRERGRFMREFERAAVVGAKIYLLVEDASFEAVYRGRYNSRMHPESLMASILAWLARYDCQILFCKQETSGRLIHDILYRELKELLQGLDEGEEGLECHG